MSIPTQTLPSGDEMPRLGFGTWDASGQTATDAVSVALEAGYTHVDTAEGYHNETAVGEALADYDREDVFLTSKVLPSNLDYESVIESCHASLDRLGTDYLDLYLIHWPNPAISLRETLAAFERLQEDGLIRNVGVSNFSTYQLRFARHISDVPIAVNQIEFHPLLYRERLLSFCQEHDVAVTAAAPLARAKVFDHPVIGEVADAYDRSPVQVALRWELQKGVIPIPKSTTPEHIRSNLDVFEWELDDEDVARIDDIDAHERVYMIDPEGDVYGISR